MSDLFHERVELDYVARVFEIMTQAKHHVFQILTKRHERLAELAPELPWPANVWMGVSIENKRWVLALMSCGAYPRLFDLSRQSRCWVGLKAWTSLGSIG